MKYVIYGAGYRGRELLYYLKSENILAFIDSNKNKQGKKYCEKPIISLKQYMQSYSSCFVIITPLFSDNIESILEGNNIYQYNNLIDMPSEFAGFGDCSFEMSFGSLKIDYKDRSICIYGINAVSFMLYNFLQTNMDVSICPEIDCKLEKLEWIKKYHPKINLVEQTKFCDVEVTIDTVGAVEKYFIVKNVINIFEYVSNNKYYWNEQLLQFKNIYKEKKKCFIIATGPSLRIDDLYTLAKNNIFCFGVNQIVKIENEWTADIYVAVDRNFVSNHIDNIRNYKCNYKFIGDGCRDYWANEYSNSYKIHAVTAGPKKVKFSEDICQKLYDGYDGIGTVTYECLQLAVYMGFSEIYLLGADCSYVKGSKNNHFIPDNPIDNIDYKEESALKLYKCAREYADSHGIKILNVTRGGKLDVFERRNFDDVIAKWEIQDEV